jgi:hypothetical protein
MTQWTRTVCPQRGHTFPGIAVNSQVTPELADAAGALGHNRPAGRRAAVHMRRPLASLGPLLSRDSLNYVRIS